MFSRFETLVALRYLRPRRAEGFVSVIAGFSFLGIMLGVATLVIVMSVMNGFRQELFTRILGLNAHAAIIQQTATQVEPLENYKLIVDEAKKIKGVVAAQAVVEGQAMVAAQGRGSGALIRGISAADINARPILRDGVKLGTLDQFQGDNVVMIGYRMAQRLGVTMGDYITLISPQSTSTPFGSIPRSRAYRVVGIFDVGMYEYDNGFVYMPLEAAQLFFGYDRAVSAVEILTDNPMNVDDTVKEMSKNILEPVAFTSWKRVNGPLFNAIEVERNVMFLILTMIIVVAAFNIISGMIMLVKDKGRAIAILRTMGATRASIMRIFFMSGASIGVSGTIFGLILGVAFAANIEEIRQFIESLTGTELFAKEIYFLSKLPAKIDWTEVVSVAAMSLGLSFLATLYPSWKASRLDPVEALRHE